MYMMSRYNVGYRWTGVQRNIEWGEENGYPSKTLILKIINEVIKIRTMIDLKSKI